MKKLQDKIALITGGGTGIGRAIAKLFAEEGAVVVLCGRREQPLKDACEEIAAAGGRCSYQICDIGDEAQTVAMFRQLRQQFGRLDILVNNASVVGQIAPIDQMDVAQWEQTLRINVTGLVICQRLRRTDHG